MRIAIVAILLVSVSALAQSGNVGDGIIQVVVHTIEALTSDKRPIDIDEIGGRCEILGKGDVKFPAPCNGVQIILLKEGAGEVARAPADGHGEFRFRKLKPGIYDVSIESSKFKLADKVKNLKPGSAYLMTLQ